MSRVATEDDDDDDDELQEEMQDEQAASPATVAPADVATTTRLTTTTANTRILGRNVNGTGEYSILHDYSSVSITAAARENFFAPSVKTAAAGRRCSSKKLTVFYRLLLPPTSYFRFYPPTPRNRRAKTESPAAAVALSSPSSVCGHSTFEILRCGSNLLYIRVF